MKRSSLTPIALLLGWIVSLGLVFILGVFSAFSFHESPEAASDATLTPVEREAAALYLQLTGAPIDWAALKSYNPRERVPVPVEAIFDALTALPGEAERVVLSERFFRVVPPAKLGAALENALRGAVRPADRAVLTGIARNWLATDPATATAFLEAARTEGRIDADLFAAMRRDAQ